MAEVSSAVEPASTSSGLSENLTKKKRAASARVHCTVHTSFFHVQRKCIFRDLHTYDFFLLFVILYYLKYFSDVLKSVIFLTEIVNCTFGDIEQLSGRTQRFLAVGFQGRAVKHNVGFLAEAKE